MRAFVLSCLMLFGSIASAQIKFNPDSTQVFRLDGKKWKLIDTATCHNYKMEGLSLLYTGNRYALAAKNHGRSGQPEIGAAIKAIADSLHMLSMYYGIVYSTCRSLPMTEKDKERRKGFVETYWFCKKNFEAYRKSLQKPTKLTN